MAQDLLTITIDADSDLGRALADAERTRVVLVRDGQRFRVTRERDDPWVSYDPDRVGEVLRKFAQMTTPEQADELKERVYRGREEGTRSLDQP